MGIEIKKYDKGLKQVWDTLVSSSKNATFLYYRDFMEYHSHRFDDHSLLFYYKDKPVAALPANIEGDVLYSHQGLTYGGLVLPKKITTSIILEIFDNFLLYLKSQHINQLIYKPIPYIYHSNASQEDLYALFRNNAELAERSISTCIFQNNQIPYSELRRRGIRKATNLNLYIKENNNFELFWEILKNNLSRRFHISPVHTLSEIEYLKSKFPDHIHLFEVYNSEAIVAGCVIFETDTVAHVQYISASEDGKNSGALDLLFDYLIMYKYCQKPYFDFGTSTEKNGLELNSGLIAQKEGFGGRGVVYDTYRIKF